MSWPVCQVVAPVRETCAQTLGVALRHMNETGVSMTVDVLLKLLREDQWEARHGGLLGIKYALAVRQVPSALCIHDKHGNKHSKFLEFICFLCHMVINMCGCGSIWDPIHLCWSSVTSSVSQDLISVLLPRVLPAIIVGLQDLDDDVRAVAASALIPVVEGLVQLLPNKVREKKVYNNILFFHSIWWFLLSFSYCPPFSPHNLPYYDVGFML